MIRHKGNMERIIHHSFYPKGSTMVMWPWHHYSDRTRHQANRKRLADRVRALRADNKIPKGWVGLA
jgi:hypothetical protein